MISIVTITFNNYDELIKTVNSIPHSTSTEHIVINGGTCKKTIEFLTAFSGKHISEKDNGISDAFNKGIKFSTGEYIMFLNSGDILLDKNYPQTAQKYLDEHADISFIHSNIIFSDGLGADLFMRPHMSNAGRGMPYNHPTMVVRKKVFDEIGYFREDLRYAMDLDLVVRMEKKGLKGFYLDTDAVVRMDGAGVSVSREIDSINECYRILKNENYLSPGIRLSFYKRYILYLLRKVLIGIGAKSLLKKIKQMKHRPQANL